MPKLYVVTAPPEIRGIYATWRECEVKVKGVRGARFQAVATREHAEAMLRGEGTALTPGLWAFVDGNHLGGVGVVIVRKVCFASRRISLTLTLTKWGAKDYQARY